MKRPFFIVALAFLSGILIAQVFHPPLGALFGPALLAGAGALVWSKGRPALLILLLILAGWANIAWRMAVLSPIDLRAQLGGRTELVVVRGILRGTPRERMRARKQEEVWAFSAALDVEEIQIGHQQWRPAYGTISVSTKGALGPEFFDGRRMEVAGALGPPSGPVAPGLFDARAFLGNQGIDYQLRAETNDWRICAGAERQEPPLAARFGEWARGTLALGLPEDQSQRLIRTLMLDWRAPMTREVEEPFMAAGTFHIFAVDGLRIGLVSGILLLILRALRVPREAGGWLVLAALWFYVALTGYPASAIRAAIMASVLIAGWALRRPADLLNSLFVACFIILAWDPRQLFQAGFQLSFVVVWCIVQAMDWLKIRGSQAFGHPIPLTLQEKESQKIGGLRAWMLQAAGKWLPLPLEWVSVWIIRDPMMPDPVLWRRFSRARHIALTWRHWSLKDLPYFGFLRDVFLMSLAAWLGAVPLTAYYFHVFNPVSVLANFFVVPLTVLGLAAEMASLMVGGFWTFGSELFNNEGWLLMEWITGLSRWFAGLPGGCFNVSAPHVSTMALYYAAFGVVAAGKCREWRRKPWFWALAAGLAVWWGVDQWRDHGETRLYVLPLQGGHAVFAEGPGGRNFLADCGHAQPVEAVTMPFLQAAGVNRLNGFCATHASARQMGGAGLLLEKISTDAVFVSGARARSAPYRAFTASLEADPRRRPVQDGTNALGWDVLHPATPGARTPVADDGPVVLLRRIDGVSVLLLSDLSRAGQNALLERHPDLRADIVIAGLPSMDEPVCDGLIQAVKPQWVIIADSEVPVSRRAPAKCRERLLRQCGGRALFCSDTGALALVFSASGWRVEDASGQPVELAPRRAPPVSTAPDEAPPGSEDEED